MAARLRLAALVSLLLTGCAPRPAPELPVVHADPHLKVSLSVHPSSPRQMDPARFTVTLRDAQGQPIHSARVKINLQMPAMDMGQDAVAVSPQPMGVYSGTGRFTMPGSWQIIVTAACGPEHTMQSFPITIR